MQETTMNARVTTHATRKIHWSTDGFRHFWAKPDAALVPAVLTDDVVGYWPGRAEPASGVAEYTNVIAELISLLPDLRLEVAEHAANGDVVFVRWIMRATGKHGPMQITGIDRIRLRDGLVAENLIRFDSEEFRRLSGYDVPGSGR
jgi:ketosteroid isomerase-like protein